MKHNTDRRSWAMLLLTIVVFALFGGRLIQVQLIQGDEYAALAAQYRSTDITVAASRGEILDRNGNPLAANRMGFCLVLDYARFPWQYQNTLLLRLIHLLQTASETWTDTFPLTSEETPSFIGGRESSVSELRQLLGLDTAADAAAVMDTCIQRYGLQEYTPVQQRLLAGVRYSMETAGFNASTPFLFAYDVSQRTAAVISEDPHTYGGVIAHTQPVREYVCATTAAHIVGTIGPIYAEEYAKLKNQGYRMTDTVGKSGLEYALESTLRGTAGVYTRRWNADGTLHSETETKTAVAGDSVVLTLDSDLQAAAQDSIERQMAALRLQTGGDDPYDGRDVRGGAAVLLDVRDGGVLVCASCPGYDLSQYRESYTSLAADETSPLFNRALFGTFPCGSVIKPAVAIAGLSAGVIQPRSELIVCDGRYHYYDDVGFSPKCMGSHGGVTLTEALQRSCNVYFYETGRLLGIDTMNRTLSAFGLGEKTGLEIGEAAGILASPGNKNGTWVAGDTCQCAIGQMDQRFTPIQLASYAMSLANDGVRYRTHLVSQTRSYDGTITSRYQPEILSTVVYDKEIAAAVREGMCAVVKRGGTAYTAFADAAYTVAAKTGTAQNSNVRSDHGVFIAYAPVEEPQVAVAVVMENGTSAAATAVAREILDAYFMSS